MATSSTLPRNCVASSIDPKAPWQLVGWSKLVLLTSLRKILSDALFPSGSPFGDFDPHDGDRDFFGKTGIVSDTRKQLYSVCWLGCWRPCCGFHQVTPGVFIDNIDNTLLWHLFRDSITLLMPHILIWSDWSDCVRAEDEKHFQFTSRTTTKFTRHFSSLKKCLGKSKVPGDPGSHIFCTPGGVEGTHCNDLTWGSSLRDWFIRSAHQEVGEVKISKQYFA